MPRFYREKRQHNYYGEQDAVSEAESKDMWKERARKSAELSKRGKEGE